MMKSVGRVRTDYKHNTCRQTAKSKAIMFQYWPWTYFGVGLQGGLKQLWLCTISKRHLQTHFLGNSLEVAVCALQLRKWNSVNDDLKLKVCSHFHTSNHFV